MWISADVALISQSNRFLDLVKSACSVSYALQNKENDINELIEFGRESGVLNFCAAAVGERETLGQRYAIVCAAVNFPFGYACLHALT